MRLPCHRPRAVAMLVALAIGLLASPARALDALWPTDVNASGHRLKGLAAPGAGADALRLQDMAVGSCLLKGTGVNVATFVCGVDGTDYLSPSTGLLLGSHAATSVLGRAGGTTGNAADIAAGADGQVLERAAGALTWGLVGTAGLAANAVTYAKLQLEAPHTLLGNPNGTSAVPSEISLGTTSGLLQLVSGSPDTLAAFAAQADQLLLGAATGGGAAQSSALVWKQATSRFGVGTSAPLTSFDYVNGTRGDWSAFPYFQHVLEIHNDAKVAILSSDPSGTAALEIGSTKLTNVAGRYPVYELQSVPGGKKDFYKVRWNYQEFYNTGVAEPTVTVPDAFDIYGDGMLSSSFYASGGMLKATGTCPAPLTGGSRPSAGCFQLAIPGTDYQAAGNYLLDPGSNGILVRTALNTTSAGHLTGPVTTSGTSLLTSLDLTQAGITGPLALNLMAAPAGTGFATTNAGAWGATSRSFTSPTGSINIGNPTGAAGNPTFDLPRINPAQSVGGSGIASIAWDDFGRIVDATAQTFVTPTTNTGFVGDITGSGPIVGPIPVALSQNGATNGQLMTWNAVLGAWRPANAPTSGANALGFYLVTQATNAPANAVNLGALSGSGMLGCTISGGNCTPTSTAFTAQQIAFGSGSNGGLAGSANLTWDGAKAQAQSASDATVLRLLTNSTFAAPQLLIESSAGGAGQAGLSFKANGISTYIKGDASGDLLATASNSGGIGLYVGNFGTQSLLISNTGTVTMSSLASAGTQCVQANSTGLLSVTGLPCGGGSLTWPAAQDVLFSTGTSTTPSGSSNFIWDGTKVLSQNGSDVTVGHFKTNSTFTNPQLLLESSNASGQAGVGFRVNGSDKAAIKADSSGDLLLTGIGGGGLGLFVGNFATQGEVISNTGTVTFTQYGSGIAKLTSGLLGTASSADVAGAIVWPAANDILYSGGTGAAPGGTTNFQWDGTKQINISGSDAVVADFKANSTGTNSQLIVESTATSSGIAGLSLKVNGSLGGVVKADSSSDLLLTAGAGGGLGLYVANFATQGLVISNTGTVTLPSLVSGGTQCVQVGSTGQLSGTGSACGTGGGGTSYTFSTGLNNASSTITANLSTGVSGGQSVIGGTSTGNLTLTSNTSHNGQILLGNSGAVGVLDELGKVAFGQTTVDAGFHVALSNDTSPAVVSAWDSRHFCAGGGGSTGGALCMSATSGTSTVNLTALAPNVAWWNLRVDASTFAIYGGGTNLGLSQDASGNVSVATLSAGGVVTADASTGRLRANGAGLSSAAKALDYTVKIPGQGAGTPGGWWITSSTLPSNGNSAFSTIYEYPTRLAATQAVLTVIVVHNTQVSDTQTVRMTRNSTNPSSPSYIGSGVTVTASTPDGTVLGEVVSVGSGAIGDTYGITNTGTGSDTSGNLELIATITLNP